MKLALFQHQRWLQPTSRVRAPLWSFRCQFSPYRFISETYNQGSIIPVLRWNQVYELVARKRKWRLLDVLHVFEAFWFYALVKKCRQQLILQVLSERFWWERKDKVFSYRNGLRGCHSVSVSRIYRNTVIVYKLTQFICMKPTILIIY